MNGPGDRGSKAHRPAQAPGMVRFSTDDLPEAERLQQWRDVVGRTLTGCNPSPLEGGDLFADFGLVAGEEVRLCMIRLRHLRNNRDLSCLPDGDDDLVFFSLLGGGATVEQGEHRIRLARGDGVLARFDRTLDTSWPEAELMLIRVSRSALRGCDPEGVAGLLHPGSSSLMRLLRAYGRAAWHDASSSGRLGPMATRHIAELVGAMCASNSDDASARARHAAGPARVAAMREMLRRRFADPDLSMRDVAAAVGISERAGHLAFQAAGLGFTAELQEIRLERARERLAAGNGRVIDVAFAVGFSDISHFYRLFRQRYGCTPGDVRDGGCGTRQA